MDYRQKMVAPTSQKLKHDDDDDEDLEALRLAALKSLRAKHTLQNTQQPTLLSQPVMPRIGYPYCPVYNHQRQIKRSYDQNRPPRQNGNTYYPSRVNRNLIEIIPVDGEDTQEKDITRNDSKIGNTDFTENTRGDSKFYRYKDNRSGSEEEDGKDIRKILPEILLSETSEVLEKVGIEKDIPERSIDVTVTDPSPIVPAVVKVDTKVEVNNPEPKKEEEEKVDEPEEEEEEREREEEEADEEEGAEEEEEEDEEETKPTDDDDDVLLMADLEEEDSLERLMDEMEREMNVDKISDKKEKKTTKRDTKESRKSSDLSKVRNRRSRMDRGNERNGLGSNVSLTISGTPIKSDRSLSPRPSSRSTQKRRSLSPKPRLRKKSPRRSSPRRSPLRISKKSFRESTRMRSPRKSPSAQLLAPGGQQSSSRFSPRPRSPKLSPRGRSPLNRSPPMRRCSPPMRKLSPRGRSPRSRSPRNRRSRSPRLISRSRSPRPMRSPKRSNRSRSPRIRTSRSITPRSSPIRTSSPRLRSPRLSPRRIMASPRQRSPKISSPERRRPSPSRQRSPIRHSPHRSPWSSPRNSPRLSPRRRRSPKETRKTRQRSVTPEESSGPYKRENAIGSPGRKMAASSPENLRLKGKQKETMPTSSSNISKDSEVSNDPILEARRRKFENTKLIDPIHDNKKIKLVKRDTTSKRRNDVTEETGIESPKGKKSHKIVEESYEDLPEADLELDNDYAYEGLEDVASDESSNTTNTVAMCVEMLPVKIEKEKSTKKKKKRDKEIYQVGKLNCELPLSERICKEKKCKKRKDRGNTPMENSSEEATVVEDLTIDEEEADLRTELSRRRAERLNRAAPIQSARLLQSAFKGVVNEVAKTNAKVIQRHGSKGDEKKNNKKDIRRVTVLHRTVTDLPDSEDDTTIDSKVPIRFRLGINKPTQENNRESKAVRKSSKRQGRKA